MHQQNNNDMLKQNLRDADAPLSLHQSSKLSQVYPQCHLCSFAGAGRSCYLAKSLRLNSMWRKNLGPCGCYRRIPIGNCSRSGYNHFRSFSPEPSATERGENPAKSYKTRTKSTVAHGAGLNDYDRGISLPTLELANWRSKDAHGRNFGKLPRFGAAVGL